jgi:hypothetical protein
MVSNKTNIILRNSGFIDRTTLSTSRIRVTGSESGEHAGEFILSDDGRTIVFNPDMAFSRGEEVSVVLAEGIKTSTGVEVPEFSFTFSTAATGNDQIPHAIQTENLKVQLKGGTESLLPAPTVAIDSVNDPSPGYIFMATWDRNVPAIYGNFLFVLDKNGAILSNLMRKIYQKVSISINCRQDLFSRKLKRWC